MEKPAFSFTEPKKKRGSNINTVEVGPFPVPIATLTAIPTYGQQWCYYKGCLIGNAVHMHSISDMEAIYQMGFFGKGNLSWSSPDYKTPFKKDKQFLKQSNKTTFLKQMSKRRYTTHLEWKRSKILNSSQQKSDQIIKQETETCLSNTDIIDCCSPCLDSLHSSFTGKINERNSDSTETSNQESSLNDETNKSILLSLRRDCVDVNNTCHLEEKEEEEDEEDGDTLVVSDTDTSDVDVGLITTNKKQKTMMIKKDPFSLKEHLQLSLVEAFFLSYGLGCLIVTDENNEEMNLTKMWRRFMEKEKNFISLYAAYHHFRSKGWVVRTGIKYGVDFMLYRKGPPFYHSSYSVIIVNENEEEQNSFPTDWTSLCCLNRITEQVSKELLLCYVIQPKDLTFDDIQSPKSLSKITVFEVIIRRWVSNREREQSEFMEIS